VRLSGAGVGRLPMTSVVAGNFRNRCVLFYLLEFYRQSYVLPLTHITGR
jgi:hypothetical protein